MGEIGMDLFDSVEYDAIRRSHDGLLDACEKTREYLEERNIRNKGNIGRKVILPMLDTVIFEGKEWKNG